VPHYPESFEIAREMHRQGVRFLAGTDLVNAYIFSGFSLHDELGLLTKAGLSNLEALQGVCCDLSQLLLHFYDRENHGGQSR
jgi:imidazolonepropionase-like amidohydrolase